MTSHSGLACMCQTVPEIGLMALGNMQGLASANGLTKSAKYYSDKLTFLS